MQWTIAQVHVDREDIRDFVVNLQSGTTVTGRVRSQTPLSPLRGLRVRLSGSPGGGIDVVFPAASVDDAGRFAFSSVPPGEYRLQVEGLPAGWAAAEALSGGRDLLDVGVSVGSGRRVDDVVLTLTDRPSEITGTFVHADGRPAPDYYVIAFPEDRRHWIPGSRRIRAVRPAADGRFSFSALPPGAYRMAAVFDIEPDEWFDPVFLEALTPASIAVHLNEGERRVQDIRVAGGEANR
jgi:hypothetical protein